MSKPDSIEIEKEVISMMLFLNEYCYIPKEWEEDLRLAVTLHCRLDAEWKDLIWIIRPINAEILEHAWDRAKEARQEMIKIIELFTRKIKGPNFFARLLQSGDDILNEN